MATPKKEKSGKWSINIFVGYRYDGDQKKRVYKQLTAATKKEVQLKAAAYLSENHADTRNITLHDAIRKYIDLKESSLSPSTIRVYENVLRIHYSDDLGAKDIHSITSEDLQLFISNLSKKVGAKTVKNTLSLATAAISMFRDDFNPRITRPAVPKATTRIPAEEELRKLLEAIRGSDLEVAILLGAFIPCRASEISALNASDLEGNVLHIRRAMVLSKDHEWIIKQTPKTASSNRDVIVPDFVLSRLPKEGRLCNLVPNSIPKLLTIKCKELGIPHFKFHATRHFAPTVFKAMGMSDKLIMQRGGWETDYVMKNVYMGVMENEVKQAADQIDERFSYLTNCAGAITS